MELTLERWQSAPAREKVVIAKRLASNLPAGFAFDSLQSFQMGECQNEVAVFRQSAAQFACLPGAEVVLGFDADRPWQPNPDEQESWQGTADEYEIDKSIQQLIAEATLRPRTVRLPPILIECTARELGWEPLDPNDPEVQEVVRPESAHAESARAKAWQTTIHHGGGQTRVGKGHDGTVTAERSTTTDHAVLTRTLAASGFRFPTSDEWEYSCGAGAQTLFRWGDHVPCDRYPTDTSPAEAKWRWQWVVSLGKLAPPPKPFQPDWDLHRQPNAWGLKIASNPYECELVAEAGVTRGGDGGSMVCGGAGFFLGWLTLASAYFEDNYCRHNEPIMPGCAFGRRVLELT